MFFLPLCVFQTNAEQQSKIQELQDKLSKVPVFFKIVNEQIPIDIKNIKYQLCIFKYAITGTMRDIVSPCTGSEGEHGGHGASAEHPSGQRAAGARPGAAA